MTDVKTLLLGAASITALCTAVSGAPDAIAQEDQEAAMEEMVVTGIRGSLM